MTASADPARLQRNAGRMAGRLKLLAHSERLAMLCRLDQGEATVGELIAITGLSQSSVSQHLALLREQGIVTCRADKQARLYSIVDPDVQGILDALCAVSAAWDETP